MYALSYWLRYAAFKHTEISIRKRDERLHFEGLRLASATHVESSQSSESQRQEKKNGLVKRKQAMLNNWHSENVELHKRQHADDCSKENSGGVLSATTHTHLHKACDARAAKVCVGEPERVSAGNAANAYASDECRVRERQWRLCVGGKSSALQSKWATRPTSLASLLLVATSSHFPFPFRSSFCTHYAFGMTAQFNKLNWTSYLLSLSFNRLNAKLSRIEFADATCSLIAKASGSENND